MASYCTHHSIFLFNIMTLDISLLTHKNSSPFILTAVYFTVWTCNLPILSPADDYCFWFFYYKKLQLIFSYLSSCEHISKNFSRVYTNFHHWYVSSWRNDFFLFNLLLYPHQTESVPCRYSIFTIWLNKIAGSNSIRIFNFVEYHQIALQGGRTNYILTMSVFKTFANIWWI